MKYRQRENIVTRTVYQTYFLINIEQNYLNDECIFYEVNEIGHFLWEQLKDEKSVEELTDELIAELSEAVVYDEILHDVQQFLDILRDRRFLEAI